MNSLTILLLGLHILMLMNCGSPTVIPDEYNDKLINLRERLSTVINEQTANLVKGRERIRNVIATAKESLIFELEQLKQYMRESKTEAKEDNYDISSCFDESVLNTVNIDTIESCENQPGITYIAKELQYLYKKYDAFYGDMTGCIENENNEAAATETPDESNASNNCLNEAIGELEIKIVVAESIVEALCVNAYQLTLRCVKLHLTQLDKEIVFIARNFTACTD